MTIDTGIWARTSKLAHEDHVTVLLPTHSECCQRILTKVILLEVTRGRNLFLGVIVTMI